jgi:hypothetical protein
LTSTSFYQSVIHAVWVNTTKSPYQDPRVRRALHLVLDRPILVAVVKELAPMLLGGFIYPISAFATPAEELSKRLGYQADPKAAVQEARRLIGVCFLDRAHLLSEAQMGLVSSAGRSALNMARDQPETQQSIAGA